MTGGGTEKQAEYLGGRGGACDDGIDGDEGSLSGEFNRKSSNS